MVDISWNEMRTVLQSKVNSSYVDKFMEEMILERQQLELPSEIEFNGKKILFDYQRFLRKAGYYLGKIYTGALLVWRSLIKYLEQIQKSDEFRNLKAKLLENWCYKEAEKRDLHPEKLILKNSNIDLSQNQKYKELKSQISDFPKKPLKLKVDAPNNLNFAFREFDVIFRVGDYLFLIECKATSIPIGEFGEYSKWIEYSNKRLEKQDQKEKLLKNLIDNNLIQHQLFDNIKEYISIQLQTEGLIHAHKSVTCKSYIKILDDLKNSVQEKRVDEFVISYKKKLTFR